MVLHALWRIFALILITIFMVDGCSLTFWEHWSMEKIMYNQDIVVFGKETERYDVNNTQGQLDRRDATFVVFCVLKNKNTAIPVPANIILHMVWPTNSCSGTDSKYSTNQEILLGLKRRDDESYEWDEPNPTPDGAAFIATEENLDRAARVCEMNVMAPPSGVTEDRCPTKIDDNIDCSNEATNIMNVSYMWVLLLLGLAAQLLRF